MSPLSIYLSPRYLVADMSCRRIGVAELSPLMREVSIAEMSPRQYVLSPNWRRQDVPHYLQHSVAEMSHRRNVLSPKCPIAEIACRRDVPSPKCPIAESASPKWHRRNGVAEMGHSPCGVPLEMVFTHKLTFLIDFLSAKTI